MKIQTLKDQNNYDLYTKTWKDNLALTPSKCNCQGQQYESLNHRDLLLDTWLLHMG